tara:strand:+ start:3272 stop:3979 length:708 start_codon:yes stop_codon:yes gene_type:complete
MYSIGLEQDFIFIHIPKTGGTSVKDCLIRNYPKENLFYTDFGYHAPLREYVKAIKSNPNCKPMAEYVIFVCVRNPWDRMVSLYNWKTKGTAKEDYKLNESKAQIRLDTGKANNQRPNTMLPKSLSFDDFIIGHHRFLEFKEIIPFDWWTSCEEGEYHVNTLNFNFLQNHFEVMANTVLHLKDPSLLHIHKTRHKHYSEYYDQFTAGIVHGLNSEEIDKFKWRFEMSDAYIKNIEE